MIPTKIRYSLKIAKHRKKTISFSMSNYSHLNKPEMVDSRKDSYKPTILMNSNTKLTKTILQFWNSTAIK
jgi:hypothetical protein